jgi:hypothetical protein
MTQPISDPVSVPLLRVVRGAAPALSCREDTSVAVSLLDWTVRKAWEAHTSHPARWHGARSSVGQARPAPREIPERRQGMDDQPTLRDRFAMAALQTLVTGQLHQTPESAARNAYLYADAMLAERATVRP